MRNNRRALNSEQDSNSILVLTQKLQIIVTTNCYSAVQAAFNSMIALFSFDIKNIITLVSSYASK
jgi:hypothetical protein